MVGGCRMQSIDEASFDVTLMCGKRVGKDRGCEDGCCERNHFARRCDHLLA